MIEVIVNAEAQSKLAEVETLAAKLGAAEAQLEHGYGALAYRLKEVSEHRFWEGTYKSFGEFLTHLKEKHNVGRSQLYAYLSTARELDGDVTEAQLSEMGISKALVLRDAKNGLMLPSGAVEKALDPAVTAKDLKKLLFEKSAVLEEGDWMDLGFEFMVTAEEREVFNAAINAAQHGDPPVSATLKPSAWAKQIALKWAMEYLGAHSGEIVEGGKGL